MTAGGGAAHRLKPAAVYGPGRFQTPDPGPSLSDGERSSAADGRSERLKKHKEQTCFAQMRFLPGSGAALLLLWSRLDPGRRCCPLLDTERSTAALTRFLMSVRRFFLLKELSAAAVARSGSNFGFLESTK